MRSLYIVAPNTNIDAAVITAAAGAEIVKGVPPALLGLFPNPVYPFAYIEQDDPNKASLVLALQVVRNTFRKTRTSTQIDNTLDSLTVLLRRAYSELKDLQ